MTEKPPLRVVTYNIRRGIGTDRRYDLARVGSVLAALDADLVALQEIDVAGRDQLGALGQQLGYEAIPGPALVRRRATTGNGILTRLAARVVDRLDLSLPGRESRAALIVDVGTPEGPLRCVTTHLGLRAGERRRQTNRLLAALAEWPGPCLVLGDFNALSPLSYPLRQLNALFGRAPTPATFPSGRPLLKLDRIWMRPRTALRRVFVPDVPGAAVASDHRPLAADIDLAG